MAVTPERATDDEEGCSSTPSRNRRAVSPCRQTPCRSWRCACCASAPLTTKAVPSPRVTLKCIALRVPSADNGQILQR